MKQQQSMLKQIMDENLISPAELARVASLDVKTIHNMLSNRHKARMQTKSVVLDALNIMLSEKEKELVGPDIFLAP